MLKRITLLVIAIMAFSQCGKKEQVPTITGLGIEELGPYSVVLSVAITEQGTQPITERGYCMNFPDNYSTPEYVNCDTTITVSGYAGEWVVQDTIGSLFPDSEYRVCAYALNKIGVGTSDVLIFRTKK